MKIPAWVAVASVVLCLALSYLAGERAGKLGERAATRAVLDSLAATAEHERSARDSVAGVALARELQATSATERARHSEAAAARAMGVADSLAREAQRTDSSAEWRIAAWERAYDASRAEADSLFAALQAEHEAAEAFRLAAVDLRAQLARDAARISELERVNARLGAAAGKAVECKIVLGIPCPTRTQALLGGLLAGGAFVAIASR